MINEVATNLVIADMEGCVKTDNSTCVIHACKHPCHMKMTGNVDKFHPDYFCIETPNDLYLNIIDPELPLFFKETFEVALRFIKENIEKRKLIIHCNEGLSRSPTIAMLYLFKHLSFNDAYDKFVEIYP